MGTKDASPNRHHHSLPFHFAPNITQSQPSLSQLQFWCLLTPRQGSFSRNTATLPHLFGDRFCHLTGLTWQTWRQEVAIQVSPRQLTDDSYWFIYTGTNTALKLGPLQYCLLLFWTSNLPLYNMWHKCLGQQHADLQLACRNTANLSRTCMF